MSANKHFVTSKTAGLRTLTVKTAKRSEAVPDLPTVGGSPVTAPLTPRLFRALANLGGYSDQNLSARKSDNPIGQFLRGRPMPP